MYNKIMHNKSFYPLNILNPENRKGKFNEYILITLLLCSLFFLNINCIIASRPVLVSPNTQSSPSNFIFSFKLENKLESTGYLMINFSPLISSPITPISCMPLNSSALLSIPICLNLQTDSNAVNSVLTVNKTWINQFNPNILATKTIVVQFNLDLLPNTEYFIQIITGNVLPAIGSITSNFQLYTISGTGFMIEENWNFGQVYFQYRQNNILNVNSINDLTQNQPGTLTSNLQFQITIGVQSPTPYSMLKFIISDSFQFSSSSLVNVQGVLSSAPQLIATEIRSPNIIVTKFNQSFAVGRKFKLSITDIKNPLKIASGFISVYYLPDNSMSPLEIKQLAIPIGTKIYVPTIQILTAQGIAPTSPIQFYQNKEQYLTLTIVLPRQFNSDFIIQVLTDTLPIHQGTVYAKASTVLASNLLYSHYVQKGVRISGFPIIAAGSKITITMKVWVPVTPSFNIEVRIDTLDNIANSIIKGNAPTIDTVLGQEFVTSLTGNPANIVNNNPETYKLSSMISATASPYSIITFTVTPTFLTEAGSSLKIYTCENLIAAPTFSTSTSCQVNAVARTCTIFTNDSITLITIASGSSSNLFLTNAATTIKIKDLQYKFLSSNTEYIYQFYFQITSSQSSTSPIVKKTVHTPQVVPERPTTTTGFPNYFSNDLYNTGTNYPNIFRIVSDTPAKWNYIVQSIQRRVITVFHKEGWKKLFTGLKSGDSYPFLSTLNGVTSTYIQGTTINSSLLCPLNWDKLHFILPGGQNSTSFSLAIPMTYFDPSQSAPNIDFNFEIMAGVYNTETRTISYKYIEAMPAVASPTFKRFSSASTIIGSKTKEPNTKIKLAGRAGSYKSKIQMAVKPTASFFGNSYSTALIITSTWNWFDSTSFINTANLSMSGVSYPTYTNDHQKPLSLNIGTDLFLTYIPFTTTGALATAWSLFLDNIKLPYNHDLPYYSIVLVDKTGTVDSYNEFINQDQGVFYPTTLLKITLSCSDNSLGVTNTDCSIGFIPNNQIQVKSKIYVTLTGLRVATSKCVLTKVSDNSTIQNTCASNTDRNQVVITLKNTARLTALTQYTLKVYGMSIQSSATIQYVDMSLRDPSGGYIIQTGKRILITSVSSYFPIAIEQMTYLKNNPIVVSGFNIIFSLPRKINQDEVFAIVMSNDLSNLNSVPCKLKIRLYYHTNNSQITNVRWFLNSKNYQIVFQGLYDKLDAFKYRLQIYGLKTPSTIDQNVLSLIFLRTYDNSYTLYNTPSSTAAYPQLVDKVNSQITLKPYLNTQGIQQILQFTITGQYSKVDSSTVWYITLPRYYSQRIWNDDYLAYCTISDTKLDCSRHQNIPYTIVVKNSPRVIDIGTQYTIVIHGITCPRALFLNGNSTYVTQSIFFGMAVNDTAQSFIEYSQLYMTDTVINPQALGSYGTITVRDITSSNSQTYQSSFFTIKLVCSIAIAAGDYLYLTFPQGFDNFNDIPLTGQIVFGSVRKAFSAPTVNTKMIMIIPTGISITSNSLFTIQIASLPTPKSPLTIDMNKLIITLSGSTRSSTKASSLQLHNQVSNIIFKTTELHVVINNYQTILLTAGTYTNDIIVDASDKKAFLSNMKITFISDSLKFQPSPLPLYLGNTNGKFRIGAEQTLIPTLYTFDIIKSQTSISAFYTVLSKYSVLVSNNPKTITLPTSVNMPKGGCSIPFKIALTNPPYSDLSLSFEYDSAVFTLDKFWINEEMSYNQLQFTRNITQRWVSFCCVSSLNVSTIPVSIYLGGTNANAYKLSTSSVTVNVVTNTTTLPAPSLALAIANTQKTYAKLTATVNLNGYLYYELKLSPLTSPMQLIDLKFQIKQKNLTLQSQDDYLNKQTYITDRDYRIDYLSIASGSNDLQFNNLLPERQYTFCAFFENQHRVVTSRVCQTFSMQAWGLTKKIFIQYKDTIMQNQLNTILCYFSKASNAKVNQIVSLEGKSCSLNSSATNYYYDFKGQTLSNELYSTIIYHISDQNLTTDPSSSAFSSLFDANGITNTAVSMALANFSINYISKSYTLGSFNPIDGIKISSAQFKPELSFTVQPYTRGSYSLFLRGVQLTKSGHAYFILVPYKRIVKNDIAARSDIQIRPLVTPSYEQILNCKDGYDMSATACIRVVLKEGQSLDVKFSGVQQNRMYAVFYIVTNQYPLRPIVYSSVMVKQMATVVLFNKHLLNFIIIMFSIILLVLY